MECKLNIKISLLPALLLLVMAYYGLVSCQTKKTTEMNTIEFIPKEFHNVVLGLYETGENICTPYYPDFELKLNN